MNIGYFNAKQTATLALYCDECSQGFKWRSGLSNHKRDFHEGTRYSCKVCGKGFTTQSNLSVHIQSQHEGIRFSCPVCGNLYPSKTNLNTHIKLVHNKFRYKCNQCDYDSTRQQILLEHQRNTHVGGGHITNRCDQCDYQSKLKGTLAEHRINKHGERKFHCNKCDYISTYKQSLLKHQQSSHADEDIAKHRKTNMRNASSFNATNVITKAKKKDCLLCTRKQSMRDLGSNVKNAITVVSPEAHILVTRKLHIVEQKFLNLSICLRWFVIAQCSAMIQFHNKRKLYLWSL